MKAVEALNRLKIRANVAHADADDGPDEKRADELDAELEKLESILSTLDGSDSVNFRDQIAEVFGKYVVGTQQPRDLTRKEIRILCAGLSRSDLVDGIPVIVSEYASGILSVVSRRPNAVCVGSIIRAALFHWVALTQQPAAWKGFHDFVISRLENYGGRNPQLNTIKKDLPYFSEINGPERLGRDIASSSISIVSSIKHYGLPRSFINSSYVELCTVSYCSSLTSFNEKTIEELLTITPEIGSRDVRMVVISNLLTKTSLHSDEVRSELRSAALRIIGDPQHDHLWTLAESRFENETDRINSARKRLASWINADIVSIFFSKLSEARQFDRHRLDFWSRYASEFPLVKIAASKNQMLHMAGLDFDDELIRSRTIKVRSETSPAAILFKLENQILIEFGQENNALYCYRPSHGKFRLFDQSEIFNTYMLKDSMLPQISDTITTQGRLFHTGGWQSTFERWLRNALGIKHD